MSLLLANGYPDAWEIPLGVVSDEANFIVERTNAMLVTQAQLTQLAIQSALSKKAGREFTKGINNLNVVSTPFPGLFDT